MVFPQSRTTAARAVRTPTGRWRWSLSNAAERRGLGRGLEVLLGGATPTELAELPVDAIHPNPRQPRKRFDSDAGAGLADSVRSQGVVQPVLVRPRAAGANRVRLLELAGDVLKMVERGQLTEGHARAVLAVPDHEGRRALARKIVQKGMSVRAAERAARWAGAKTKQRRQTTKLDPTLVARGKTAADRITGFSSRIVSNRLEISFADEPELEELVEALEKAAK